MAKTSLDTGIDGKVDLTEAEAVNRVHQVIDHDRDTFLPRPSDDPEDPLNWALPLKVMIPAFPSNITGSSAKQNPKQKFQIFVLLQVCILAALGTLNTAIINPAYSQLATDFNITIVQASYQTTVVIVINGVGPFLWIPLANTFGRRPIYLFTTLLGFASALASAYTTTYSQLIGARIVNGFFPAAMALGPSTVVDLFFFHERGRAMGLFTVILTTGAHLAPIIGGLVGQFCGWRWTFKLAAIMDGFMFLVILFGLPETLYIRQALTTTAPTNARERETNAMPFKSYLSRLTPYTKIEGAPQLKPTDFVLPALRMAKYPSVLFPAAYYGAQYGFGSILPAVTVAAIFSDEFGWNTLQIGLAYGGALTIGGVLGEIFAAGWFLDVLVKRARRRLGGANPAPEARLVGIWTGAVLLPVGLLVYGFALQYRVHWFVPLLGMGVACFGLQPVATTCYTYSIDCYRERGGDVSVLFNFIRQTFGMTFAFYVVDLCRRIGYHVAFVLFVIWGSVLGFVPILVLMWRGERIREWIERRERQKEAIRNGDEGVVEA